MIICVLEVSEYSGGAFLDIRSMNDKKTVKSYG